MKIRIKDNSIRLRLTKTEVENFITKGKVATSTQIANNTFVYCLESSATAKKMSAKLVNNTITVFLPENYKNEWKADDKVGFSDTIIQENEAILAITVEKDFVCLDDRDEDESDNYPNPKAGLLKQ